MQVMARDVKYHINTPAKPAKRVAASRRECLVGKTRKARKAYSEALFKNDFGYPYRLAKDPIRLKRQRRENRHKGNSWSFYR